MNAAFTLTLLLSLMIAAVFCNHDHHRGDDKWITFVSQIEAFWKTDKPLKLSETPTESTLSNKDIYSSIRPWEIEKHRHTSPTPEISVEKATTYDDVKNTAKLGLAAIISIPIVGLIVLICCCYCICKCCCGMCATHESNVIVMNPNVVQPAPQPTQVIVQQPVYNMPPPQQQMHHFPPPHQQWAPPQFQQPMPPPQYYPGDGIDNPNFQYATAPPQSLPEKY